jgi:surface antigen
VLEGVKKPNSKHGRRLRKIRQTAIYAFAFVAIVAAVAIGAEKPEDGEIKASMVDEITSDDARPTVDQVTEASIIASLAETANLPVAANAANVSASLAIKHEILQADDISAISKPQIINLKSLPGGVITHKVAVGDTLESIAAKNKISAQTLRWANGLKNNDIKEGQDLVVPSVDGVVYTVKDGDSVDSLAGKYKANAERITVFNNLEVDGLKPGVRIVIPGGVLPENERPEYVAPQPVVTTYNFNNYSYSGGSLNYTGRGMPNPFPNRDNGYAYGWCTWYVAEKRAKAGAPIGRNWGNAISWGYSAAAAGYRVDHAPSAGAILQKGNHVMYIESVSGDVVKYSEMNGPSGWNRVDYGEMSLATAASYNIIH